MPLVAVAGDLATTTTVALASAWPVSGDVVVVEADPTGGDLAAWFDMPVTPSLSTVVTRVPDSAWPDVERHTRLSASGIRLLPAPAREAEAAQAVGEASRSLFTTLATLRSPVSVVDSGRISLSPASHPAVAAANAVVVTHHQSTQSPAAAAVRLQRLVDQLEAFAGVAATPIVAVIGARPFAIEEIESLVTNAVGAIPVIGLPVDELAAAAIGGRTGVSERRFRRLPLLRAAGDLAAATDAALAASNTGLWRSAR